MSERKVLNKYYPPDYDPSKIPRVKKKSKQNDVRMMAPFNMRCNTCGNYIANATKFNAKKESAEEKYNNIMIFRFYIKCPRCMATIIFRTSPKESGYEVEHGATENFMALKLADKQAREEAEAEEEEEKINPMKHLENRTKASRQQMEASDQIQNLRSIKYQYQKISVDDMIESKRRDCIEGPSVRPNCDDEIRRQAIQLLERKPQGSKQAGVDKTSMIKSKIIAPDRSQTKRSTSSSLASLTKRIKINQKPKSDLQSLKAEGDEF